MSYASIDIAFKTIQWHLENIMDTCDILNAHATCLEDFDIRLIKNLRRGCR